MLVVVLTPCFFAACSFQSYQAKPLDPQASLAKLDEKDLNGSAFLQFMLAHGYQKDQLPVAAWGLEELTYCALFFHPSLNVYQAQSRLAELAVASAAESPIPTVNANLAHSNDPDPAKKPYALGLSIDLPIVTASKGEIRVENAKNLSDIAKLQLAQKAWQVRNDLAQTWLEYHAKQEQIGLLSKEQGHYQTIVAIHQKRVELGLASNVELSSARLQAQTNAALLDQAQQQLLNLSNQLASKLGLSPKQVKQMVLKNEISPPSKQDWSLADIQRTALLNRIDLRIALLRYASAEGKLKLEIANQYPDLLISPGYAIEFSDSVWSLGLSGLLNLLHKNKLAIAEAEQLREVEAAQFEALQSQILADTNGAHSELAEAQRSLIKQQNLLSDQQTHEKRMSKLLSAGQIDRLAYTLAKLETVIAEKNLAVAQYQFNDAIRKLEHAIEKPLTSAGAHHES